MATNFSLNEYLTIDTTGSVGIGTNVPLSRLHVTGSNSSNFPTFVVRSGNAIQRDVGILDVQNSAGTSLLFVSGSGNVGIGTASPQEKAHVYGNLKVGVLANGSYISLADESTAGRYVGIFRGAGDTALSVGGYSAISFTVGAAALGSQTERVRIDSSGNVGIGTSTYVARLFVSGSSTASTSTMVVKEGVVSPTGGVGVLNVQNSAGTSLLFVSGSGRVGIGTTSPASNLSVASSTYNAPGLTNKGAVQIAFANSNGLSFGSYDSGAYATYIQGISSPSALTVFYPIALNPVGGNVGIGTASPGAKLEIKAQINGEGYGLKVDTNTRTDGEGYVWFGDTATPDFYVDTTGNVGIGTAATNGNKLSVNGATAITGSILPGATSTYDLGSSGMKWRTVYATNLTGSLTQLADGTSYLIAGTNVSISTGSAGAVTINASLAGGAVTGTGTTNYYAKFTDTSIIGSGIVYDNGTNVGIGTSATNGNMLSVNGSTALSGSVLPGTTLTYDLGSSSKSWRELYARTGSFSGDVTISGNLTVEGTKTIINTQIVEIKDNAILLNAGPSPAATGGVYVVDTTSGVTGSLIWDATTDQWKAGRLGSEITLVSGSGTASYLARWNGTNSSLGASNVVYDDGTSVGIGTVSTEGARLKLYIHGSSGLSTGLLIHSGTLGTGVNSGVAYDASTLATFRYSNGNTSLLKIKGIRHTAGSDWTYAATRIQQVTDSTNQAYIDFNPAGSTGLHAMAFGTLNFERMRIDTNGNVGIGGTNPLSRFEVTGSGATSATSTMNLLNSSNTSLLFVRDDGAVGIGTVTPALSGFNFKPLAYDSTSAFMGTMTPSGGAYSSGFVAFGDTAGTKYVRMAYAGSATAANEVATIDFAGTNRLAIGGALYVNSTTENWNVGIGGTNPLSRFEVTGSGATSATSTMNLLNSSNTSLLFVRDDGNVGIGSSSPGYKLTVGGTVYATAFSGSLTKLSNGTAYLIAGSNITLTTGSSGAITIDASLAGGTIAGAGTNGYITKWTGLYTAGSSNIYDSGTDIGIGTASPGTRFHVYSGATDEVARFESTGDPYISLFDTNARQGYFYSNASSVELVAENKPLYLQGATEIRFRTNTSADRMVIDSSGNVVVGTTTSDNRFNVYTTSANGTDGLRVFGGATTSNVRIRPAMSAGANNNIVQAGDSGIIFDAGSVDSGAFVIAPWASSTSGLRITSVGNVGIGTTSADYKLKVAGTVHATAFSGSLTKLTDGTSFLIAGPNITISTGSSGAVTIQAAAAPAAPSKASAYGTITGSLTMGRTSLGEYVWTQISSSAVNFLKTPTLTTSGGNVLVNSSFTFYSTDPFVQTSFTLARSADAGSTWTNLADSVAISNSSTTGRLLQTVAIGDIQTNIIPVNMMYFDTSLAAGSYIYTAYYKGVSGSADLGNGGEIYSILAYEV